VIVRSALKVETFSPLKIILIKYKNVEHFDRNNRDGQGGRPSLGPPERRGPLQPDGQDRD